jgi:hypothetical protein
MLGWLKIPNLLDLYEKRYLDAVFSTDLLAYEFRMKLFIYGDFKLPFVRGHKEISLPLKSTRDVERVQCAQNIAL